MLMHTLTCRAAAPAFGRLRAGIAIQSLAASATQRRHCAASATPGKVKVTFVDAGGKRVETLSRVGTTLMESARDDAKVDIEAACDGTCACSTCHVYIDAAFYKACGEPCEDELDMLDMAMHVRDTSRLSCQVKLDTSMDGMVVTLPQETSNQLS